MIFVTMCMALRADSRKVLPKANAEVLNKIWRLLSFRMATFACTKTIIYIVFTDGKVYTLCNDEAHLTKEILSGLASAGRYFWL